MVQSELLARVVENVCRARAQSTEDYLQEMRPDAAQAAAPLLAESLAPTSMGSAANTSSIVFPFSVCGVRGTFTPRTWSLIEAYQRPAFWPPSTWRISPVTKLAPSR